MKKKVLVVVAHPDDETIWMGGTLIKNKNSWNTTIISLCRKDDKDRSPKFRRVCREYNARCFMSDLEDETLEDIDIKEVISRLKKYSKSSYDYIFTHGDNGEYGHKRHKDVSKAVNKMFREKQLIAKKIFFFDYKKRANIAVARAKSDKFIKINNAILQKKKDLIVNTYGFPQKSFEELCCKAEESFKIEKAK